MAIARDTVVYQGVVSTFRQPVLVKAAWKAVGIGGWDSVPYFDADLHYLKYMDRLGMSYLKDCYVMMEFSDGL